MRNAIWKASACKPAPRSAAKACSRTSPNSRERRVRAETRPASRSRERGRVSLTLCSKACKLLICRCHDHGSLSLASFEEVRVAHHASALKQMRQSLKHRARNRKNLSLLKTQVKKLRAAIAKGDAETARQLLPETVGSIDKASKKGVIHGNAASRYKSRLTRRINALAAK